MAQIDVHTLENIRTTAWQGIEECPHRWAFNKFIVGETPDNKYSRWGTAVHSVVERYLKNEIESTGETWAVAEGELRQVGVSYDEIAKTNEYLTSLEPLRPRVRELESEFILRMPGVGVPVIGHRDVIYELEDGAILIQDHKTNRGYKDVSWWRQRMQPLIYTWATRFQYPDRPIYFEIGYVNLGSKVRWLTNPDDDWYLMLRMQETWRRLCEFSSTGIWPQVFNDDCGFCPLRDRCPTFQNTTELFVNSMQSLLNERTPEELYVFAARMKSIADDMLKQLKPQVVESARKQANQVRVDGQVIRLEYSARRHAEFLPVWTTLVERAATDPKLTELVMQYAPDLFTLKVGGLDKLMKARPELRSVLEPHINRVESSEPTISITPAMRALKS